ncbi:hypothetical protein [Macrococcus equi]|uniref:hypothetical protein n=1 Tax=Macrococcus equi TaxID=3395462 RepID=UPI0039BDAD10
MKHITEWEIKDFSSPSINLFKDERSISLVKPSNNNTFHVLALLEYQYDKNNSLIVNSSDDYAWKLDADIEKEVLVLDFKNPELNNLWK